MTSTRGLDHGLYGLYRHWQGGAMPPTNVVNHKSPQFTKEIKMTEKTPKKVK